MFHYFVIVPLFDAVSFSFCTVLMLHYVMGTILTLNYLMLNYLMLHFSMLHCIKAALCDVSLFDVAFFDAPLFRYCTI